MAAAPILEGYELCACGEWVRDEVAAFTGKRCVACFQASYAGRLQRLELVGGGARVRIAPKHGKRRKKKTLTERRQQRRALARSSREAARLRVCAMVPALYEAVLAEERAKRGLDPLPIQIAIRAGDFVDDLRYGELLASITVRGAADERP